LFERRILEGNIRDCHGDLRTGHIYFTDDGIQIIDCIEFNNRFRYGDIASDLAFLAMDIDFLEFSQTAHSLIKAYACYSDDPDIFTLLDFYKCYRAMVRLKVNCFRLQQNDLNPRKRMMLLKSTRRYLKLAYQYAENFVRPTLWIVFGMIATGKSTLAQEISERLDIKLFRSDVIRKELFTHETARWNTIPFKEGIYSKHATSLVYGKLFLLAQEEIDRGNSVILDATFSSKDHRSEAFRMTENMDVNIVFVECKCRDTTILKRLEKRQTETSVSDARPKLFKNFKNDYEAPNEIRPEFYIAVDTEESTGHIMENVFSYIDLFGLGV
jgi:predicted kinase